MTALYLAPHNDDEVLWGTYTLLREQPHVVVCLRSARMGTPGYPPPLIDAETREAETAAAMDTLGLDWTQLPVPDDAPDWDAVEACMREWSHVDDVFAPAFEQGGHEQHNAIAQLARDLFGYRVIPYTTYTRHSGRTRGRPVPYESHWPAIKRQALDCYQSQASHPMTRMWFEGSLEEFTL